MAGISKTSLVRASYDSYDIKGTCELSRVFCLFFCSFQCHLFDYKFAFVQFFFTQSTRCCMENLQARPQTKYSRQPFRGIIAMINLLFILDNSKE